MLLFGYFVLFLTQIKLFFREPYQQFHSTWVTPFRKEENTPSSGCATIMEWGSAYMNKSRSTLHLCLSKLSGRKQVYWERTDRRGQNRGVISSQNAFLINNLTHFAKNNWTGTLDLKLFKTFIFHLLLMHRFCDNLTCFYWTGGPEFTPALHY